MPAFDHHRATSKYPGPSPSPLGITTAVVGNRQLVPPPPPPVWHPRSITIAGVLDGRPAHCQDELPRL